jgi:glycosyltransferase involved in cell wall biosynthesis
MLRLTVIIPTYHRPVLLERALRSIAAQAVRPAEIIVVDDGTEGHRALVRRAAANCALESVQVVVNTHGKGVSGARNTGAELSTGKLLAFLDDDDEWLPDYLAEALTRFRSRRLDMICADLVYQFDDGTERPGKKAPDRLAPNLFLTRNPGLIGSNLIIRSSVYHQIGGFDEGFPSSEDMDFGIRASLIGGIRYEPLHRALVRHHQHSGVRLSTPEGEAMRAGVRRFYELHGHRMTAEQLKEFQRVFWTSTIKSP